MVVDGGNSSGTRKTVIRANGQTDSGDAWERCLQFNKTRKFNMYQEAVMVPMGDWAEKRLKKLSETDQSRDTSKVGSGFGKNVSQIG